MKAGELEQRRPRTSSPRDDLSCLVDALPRPGLKKAGDWTV